MEVKAVGKYISVSPKKAREIADLVRGKKATEASALIRFMPQSSARIIGKVLSSAMANAENNFNLDKNELMISKITIDGGPTLKRHRPRARGAAFEIKKRTSHITVVVSGEVKTKKAATPDVKAEKGALEEKADKTIGAESLTQGAEDHKIEVERPEFAKKDQESPKFGIKNKIFRRKTG